MIDWTTVLVSFPHQEMIFGGLIQSADEHGELEWHKHKWLTIEGSFDARVQVKSTGTAPDGFTHLWISGNPAKFLYGHNVAGSDDLCDLVAKMTKRILETLEYEVTDRRYQFWLNGGFTLKKVDINYMRACGSRENARAILRMISSSGVMKYGGRGQFTGDTLYFAKHSRRRAIKLYCKGDELEQGGKKHELPQSLDHMKDELLKTANDVLRIELVLHALELKELGLQDGRKWKDFDVEGLFNQYVSRIEFSANFNLAADLLSRLPPFLVRTYSLWKEGVDIRSVLSQGTYYRHRRELKNFGIDIGALPTKA